MVHGNAGKRSLILNNMALQITLEPKPGIPPTISHMTELLASLRQTPAKMILRTAYDDPRGDEWFSERARIPAVLLPGTVGGTPEAKDLFSVFDVTVQTLLKNAK